MGRWETESHKKPPQPGAEPPRGQVIRCLSSLEGPLWGRETHVVGGASGMETGP